MCTYYIYRWTNFDKWKIKHVCGLNVILEKQIICVWWNKIKSIQVKKAGEKLLILDYIDIKCE